VNEEKNKNNLKRHTSDKIYAMKKMNIDVIYFHQDEEND
jgi:hypothetical protein